MNRRTAATAVRYREPGDETSCEEARESRNGWDGKGEQEGTREQQHKDGKPGPQGAGEQAGVPAQMRGSRCEDSGTGDCFLVVTGVAPGWEASPARTPAKPICQRIGVVETPKSRTTVKETRKKHSPEASPRATTTDHVRPMQGQKRTPQESRGTEHWKTYQ